MDGQTRDRRSIALLICLAALLFTGLLLASSPEEDTLWSRSLTVEDGLSQNFVTAMTSDRDGFMWFGTIGSLNKWNGYQFETFRHVVEDASSLSASGILALHADSAGDLWIGTPEGIDRFDAVSYSFRRYGSQFRKHGEEPVRVESITSDRVGVIWFADLGSHEIYRLNARTGQGRADVIAGTEGQLVTALYVDSADRLWMAMQPAEGDSPATGRGYELFVFDRCSEIGDRSLPAPRRPLDLDGPGGKIVAMIEDGAHRLWIARDGGGLIRYEPTTGAVDRLAGDATNRDELASGVVRSLVLGPSGEIWVLTQASDSGSVRGPGQLHRLDASTLKARRVTLRERAVRPDSDAPLERLAIDPSGVLWVGSNAGGLQYADVTAGGFSLYRREAAGAPGLNASFVRAIYRGRDGALWVGTPNGLNRIDRTNGEVRYSVPVLPGLSALRGAGIQAIHEDRDGNLWVGTNRGLVVVNRSSRSAHLYRHDPQDPRSLPDDWVQVIHEDHDGRIWIGTLGRGLGEFDPGSRSFVNYKTDPADPANLPSRTINAIFSDARHELWIGTAKGLAKLDRRQGRTRQFVRVASDAKALGDALVLSIGESPATPGVLWVGTEQRGLYRLDATGHSVGAYTTRNSGLTDDTVYGILPDRLGRLWMSTNRGLTSFDPGSGTFRAYAPDRGLQSSEFNARAYFQAEDGEMFFGGVNGLNAFFPDRVGENPNAPRVFVTAVRTVERDESRPSAPTLLFRHGMPQHGFEVDYRRRDIMFDYVALHYSNAGQNRYLYKLDNYDVAWQGPTAARTARYTNLDPRSYTFRVKALSSHGVPSSDAVFSFVVLPPFYATWWFRALAALGVLAVLFTAYRVRVQSLRRRQEQLGQQVVRRTEELRNALETLERQAQKLKELDSAKSRFFANLSHEFRTPLTLTLGPLRDVQAGLHGDITPEIREEIELAIRNTNHQLELVDQLLTLARLDAGQLEFRPRPARLDECVRLAAASFESLARRQGITLSIELPSDAVHGLFDEEGLGRVVRNLLDNALKFTPKGGTVALRLIRDPNGWARVLVEDTGPGIPAEDLPHVFERFYRGAQDAGQVPGTGIGLALAKECVDVHGGEIQVENRTDGGCRFTVRLRTIPAAPEVSADEQQVTAAGQPLESESAGTPGTDELADSGRAKVLIVDDHADMRAYLRKHLAPHYHVLEAARGDEALLQVQAEIPDAIVCDVMMPGMDGYAVCRNIKSNPDTDFIPVILLTARAGGEDRLEGLEGGADDYVTKPFQPAEVLARIRNLLRSRERLKARFGPAATLTPTPLPLQSSDPVFLDRLQEVLDGASQEETFDVAALARELGISRAQLHRRVKDTVGSTPSEVIIRFRLERAAGMLARRAGNVGEVAYAVGFKNLSHFVRRFREQYGKTPAAYAAGRHPLAEPPPGP